MICYGLCQYCDVALLQKYIKSRSISYGTAPGRAREVLMGMQSWDGVRGIHSEDQRWELVLHSSEEELRVHKLCSTEHRSMHGTIALC